MSTFFLSYAHRDADGGWVRRFYLDLCDALARMTDLDPPTIGFMDIDMRSGAIWPEKLARELAGCKFFVAVYSPRYFASEFCGKEWQVFSDRLEKMPRAGADEAAAPLIMPLLWEPTRFVVDHIPEAAEPVQYREFSGLHAEMGLRKIVENQSHPDVSLDYARILSEIVWEMKEALERHPLPQAPSLPAFDRTRNAFTRGAVRRGRGAPTPGPSMSAARSAGAMHVHLMIAAGNAGEMNRHRAPGPYYGQLPQDWTPFHPDDPTPLVQCAQQVALDQKLTPYPETVDGDIVERLAAAERDNQMVVLLIDPWSTREPRYKAALRSYDDRFDFNSGALVAWNTADPDTAAQTGALRQALRHALPKKTRKRDEAFHDAVGSHVDFKRTLLELLVFLQKMLSEHADPGRTIDVGVQISRPILSGPGSSMP